MFLNLSNHPAAHWSPEQRAAALVLAAPIADLGFPPVPADADEAAIDRLAEDCARQLPRGVTHALVQGEFTLTLALVLRLQRLGAVCLAATSTRRVQSQADGRKLAEFSFVRFRAYPWLVGGDGSSPAPKTTLRRDRQP